MPVDSFLKRRATAATPLEGRYLPSSGGVDQRYERANVSGVYYPVNTANVFQQSADGSVATSGDFVLDTRKTVSAVLSLGGVATRTRLAVVEGAVAFSGGLLRIRNVLLAGALALAGAAAGASFRTPIRFLKQRFRGRHRRFGE